MFIIYMGLPSVQSQVVTVIGGKIRIIRETDMDHFTGLMEGDTRGNGTRGNGSRV